MVLDVLLSVLRVQTGSWCTLCVDKYTVVVEVEGSKRAERKTVRSIGYGEMTTVDFIF